MSADFLGFGTEGKVKPAEEFVALEADEAPRPKRRKQDDMPNRLSVEQVPKGSFPEPKPRKFRLGDGIQKYTRPGESKRIRGIQDKKLNATLKRSKRKEQESIFQLTKAELLHTAEPGFLEAEGREKTYKFKQDDILEGATVGVKRKTFSFDLPYGQYHLAFTRNGQHLLAAGRKGHICMLHCETMQLACEVQAKETVRAIGTLHNDTMFAVAQKKYVHVYDKQGTELHCLKNMTYQTHLDFLPYHYLLVCAGDKADLHYRDISTGEPVASMRTRAGPCRALSHNPRNAVVHMGHTNGQVTLWTPTVKEPVVKMFCHAGHVTGLACHGDYMVTGGADGRWKVWDLRKFDTLATYRTYGHAVSSLDISMTGLISACFGSHVEIWKGAFSGPKPTAPYMKQEYPGKQVSDGAFRPYEDVFGVGLSSGFASILVPGAGYANYDSFEADPFETKKGRREREIKSLLDKLQPDSIMLDPHLIGNIDHKVVKAFQKEAAERAAQEMDKSVKKKKKMRGADKAGNRLKRKNLEFGKQQRDKTRSRLEGEADDSSESLAEVENDEAEGAASAHYAKAPLGTGAALRRFYGKRKRKT